MDEFLRRLADLMEEFNVDIDIEESGGYDSYPTGICIATNATWDENHNILKPWTEVISGTRSVEASDIRALIGTGRVMS
jgi:hypothetical protein